ncbi:MAG: DUF3307 domain-containing protein [Verrucomicrobiota bacterium]
MNLVDLHNPLAVFFALAVCHALADFPLQGEYIARQKARGSADSPGAWIVALAAHSLIHAGGVWLVTGSMALGAVELGLHGLIDLGKGERKFGLVTDQILHLSCKLAYTVLIATGIVGH